MSSKSKTVDIPDLQSIENAAKALRGRVLETPVWAWPEDQVKRRFGIGSTVLVKLELFQKTGSFKPRGALLNALGIEPGERKKGITAVSAGNHAAAVAFAAREIGTTAKVVMPRSANAFRVGLCRQLGAEISFVDDVHQAFDEVRRIQEQEGRHFIHPFEGEGVARGTASLGMEFYRQAVHLDSVIIPIGGGGLAAGMACAIKQLNPACRVVGVEPRGADSMHRSFRAGSPQAIEKVDTIADSLGAPHAAEYSFRMCQRFIDELVMVDDQAICEAMEWLMTDMKLCVEPAAAAASAALAGPLRGRLEGRIGLIVCGANIDSATFAQYIRRVGT